MFYYLNSGYDAAIGCPEGCMKVSPAAYSHFISNLSCLAGGRLVVLLEGGYCLDSLSEAAALTLRTLIGQTTGMNKGLIVSSLEQFL